MIFQKMEMTATGLFYKVGHHVLKDVVEVLKHCKDNVFLQKMAEKLVRVTQF